MVEVIVQDARRLCQLYNPVTGVSSRGYGAPLVLFAVLSGACAAHGNARPEPFPSAAGSRPRTEAASTDRADGAASIAATPGGAVVRAALALVGRPYALGGEGPYSFDCSGLVRYVYAQAGDVELPRTVLEQVEATEPILPEQVSAGDLLFFRISDGKPSHVAIAIGDGSFVHAPSERGRVRVERLDLPYWSARFQEARRVTPGSATSSESERE
jgi:cell wall-associated NlpC family hydrolase